MSKLRQASIVLGKGWTISKHKAIIRIKIIDLADAYAHNQASVN